jgi:transcriptional regulator with XRE-family HTH domain
MARSDMGLRFGRNLLVARTRAGFSQEELGRLAALHRTEIGLLENGKRIARVDTLVKLAASLAVSADELLAGIDWAVETTNPGSFLIEQ